MASPRPSAKPSNPRFSSGPCAKRPGWSLEALRDAALGRSHRSALGKEKLARAITLTREVLRPPADYRIAIVPGSDTGAMEMALWTLLGPRPVDILAYESFSRNWAYDILTELALPQARVFDAPFGELPDLTRVDPDNDLVFAWNGTSSGVRAPSADFIAADRRGLTICDATSAAFAQRLDFAKLDATTFSWQKSLGGEAAHGVLILSPRAVERLERFRPPWPLPKLFRLVKDGKLNEAIFSGQTINTPSLLCVEDYLDALTWAKSIGGLEALLSRVDANAAAIAEWVERAPAFDFFVKDPQIRSNTALCLAFADPRIAALEERKRAALARRLVALVEQEGAGFDFGPYRDAPPGLRIWCGATVETSDLELLTQWIDWAYDAAACEYL
jgi:phosphoserine aminotransferase